MATLTDLLVSAVCLYAFIRLTMMKLPSRSQFYIRYYFLMMSIATLLGGVIGHGFLYALSFAWKLPGWTVSVLSVNLIERSAISHAKPLIKPQIAKFFLIFNLVELLAILGVMFATLDFRWVEYHSGYGLLAIVGTFHAYTFYITKDKGSLTILYSVLITTIASMVFTFEISLHTWFNYLDFSHTLLALAAYVMYLGAIRLEKR